MSSFKKKCDFCGQEIQLSNDSGRWLPRNLDNTAHECKGKQAPQAQPQKQVQELKSTLSLEDIDKRVKKIEAVVFKDSNGK
jgi:hypothetical protein